MPKKQLFGSIIILIILCFVCIYIYDNYRVEKQTTLIVEKGNNNNTIVNYLNTKKINYYLYDIDNIIVDFTDRTLELNRALELKEITITKVLEYLEEKVNLNDGNVILYQNDDFSLLKCNLENDKTNYLFGNKTMVYKESFCYETPYLCSFTKTYYVVDINETKNDKYVYLTLRNNITEEVATIQIVKENTKNLNINSYYKFKFASNNDKIESDISSIFDNNTILEISPLEETDTIINENICK